MSKHPNISPTAQIHSSFNMSEGSSIGKKAFVGEGVRMGQHSRIGRYTAVYGRSLLADFVQVGDHVQIYEGALILDNAKVCPGKVKSNSSDARTLLARVSIGPRVVLHDEVELGENAIIPTQRTIAHLGMFGDKDRVVTIYGSDVGPRYSIGCQIGEDYYTICNRVADSTQTNVESASTYTPYINIFNEIGMAVQNAYDKEEELVEEIKQQRFEYGLVV